MKTINVVILTFCLAISSLAFAEGGGDRVAERMEKARNTAMAARSDLPVAEQSAPEKLVVAKQPHC